MSKRKKNPNRGSNIAWYSLAAMVIGSVGIVFLVAPSCPPPESWGEARDRMRAEKDADETEDENTNHNDTPTNNDGTWRSIAAGARHTCARTREGEVVCWGANDHGQLGRVTEAMCEGTPCDPEPGLTGLTARTIFLGGDSSCAETRGKDASMQCWGRSALRFEVGEACIEGDDTTRCISTPSSLNALRHATTVALGPRHGCAIFSGGTLSCWGANTDGQLGVSDAVPRPRATRVDGLRGVEELALGEAHSCARRLNGTVLCWGANDHGQLGTGDTSPSATPTQVAELPLALAVKTGPRHTCALLRGGDIACWGANEAHTNSARRVDAFDATPRVLKGMSDMVDLALGASHTCALKRSGEVYCWGVNDYGQLGLGSAPAALAPTRVPELPAAKAIVAGALHTCALLRDGEVMCWGANHQGQAGQPASTMVRTPTPVPHLKARSPKDSPG